MKRIPVYFTIAIILLYRVFYGSFIAHAQHIGSQKKTIPSDLLLDLQLAQQNPAPERKQLINSQISKVVLTTTSGDVITEIPQPTIGPQATIESTDNVSDPQLTTSEQVVTEPVTIDENQNTNPLPSDTPGPDGKDTNSTLIPGTDITTPDDNAAPVDNSTDPNLPAPTVQDQNPSISPTDQQNQDTTNGNQDTPADQITPTSEDSTNTSSQDTPTDTPDTSGQNIPLESSSQDSPATDQGQVSPTPEAPQSDTSGSSSTDQSTTDTPTDTPTPDSSVQGAAVGPEPMHVSLIQSIINSIVSFFTGK